MADDWESHKDTIYALYISSNKGLKDVICHMKEQYGFAKSKGQYERQLKKWGFCKNSRGSDWKVISYKVQKRAQRGKASTIYRRGEKVDTKKLIKERRHAFSSLTALCIPVESPKTPIDFAICTPSSFSRNAAPLSTYASNLPCLRLFNHLKTLACDYARAVQVRKMQYFQQATTSDGDSLLRETFPQGKDVASVAENLDPHAFNWLSCFAQLHVEDIVADGYASLISADVPNRKLSIATGRTALSDIPNNLFPDHKAAAALELIGQRTIANFFMGTGRSPAMKALARKFLPTAINCGSIPLVKALLDTGINPNSRLSYVWNTQLCIAASRCDIEMTAFLLSRGANAASSPSVLLCGVMTGSVQLVQLLCRAGARDDHPRTGGWTALEFAAHNENLEMVRLLLSHGVDVDAVAGENGKTALHVAASTGNYQLVQMLLDSGASDLTAALPAAIRAGNTDLVHLLIRSGADATGYLAKSGEETALQAAAAMGDFELVQFLLNLGANINAPATSEHGATALQAAASEGDLELVQFLIENGADVNARPAVLYGQTALLAAIWSGNIELVQYLMDSGADIDMESPEKTPLQEAIKSKNFEVIEFLLKSGADVDACCDIDGINITPLETAVKTGEVPIVQLILDGGADPRDYFALEEALCANSLPIVKLLLELGADVNQVVSDDRITVDDWMRHEVKIDIEIIRLLLQYGADKTKLLLAVARTGDMDIARMLLESGADPNTGYVARRETSALARAARRGDLDMVRLLLSYGANDRSSSLSAAATTPNIELIRLLLRSGADANAEFSNGYVSSSALQEAVSGGDTEIVRLLLQSGADPNIERPGKRSWRSALERAARIGNLEILKLLLDSGALVERTKAFEDPMPSMTALQIAAIEGHVGIVDELIRRGADVNAPPQVEKERTALEGAAEHGRLDTVQLLINAGANIYTSRALHFAQIEGHDAVVELLLEQ